MPIPDEIFTRGDYAEFRGQPQMIQRMQRTAAIAKMTPAERQTLREREAKAARLDAARRGFISQFKQGGAKAYFLPGNKPARDRVPGYLKATYEKLRSLSLDDSNPDQWLDFYREISARDIVGIPLGKFRFNFDANGNIVYVPWTEQSWRNFFEHQQRGRWIPNIPAMHKCNPDWETHWVNEYFNHSKNAAANYKPNDPRHVWGYKSGDAKCKLKKKSLWVKIRKPVMIAAAVVAAVYLGPLVVDKIGAALPGGGGATAGTAAGATSEAAAKVSFFTKVKSGANTVLGYVNKARTVDAIVHGELPPPPIGITGNSFREWAMIVAKEQIKEQAIELATEAGVKYVQRKMTKREEAKLRAEIEQMQRELAALIPESTPMMPAPGVPDQVQTVMVDEKKSAQAFNNTLGLAVPAGLAFLMLRG